MANLSRVNINCSSSKTTCGYGHTLRVANANNPLGPCFVGLTIGMGKSFCAHPLYWNSSRLMGRNPSRLCLIILSSSTKIAQTLNPSYISGEKCTAGSVVHSQGPECLNTAGKPSLSKRDFLVYGGMMIRLVVFFILTRLTLISRSRTRTGYHDQLWIQIWSS